MIRGGNETFIFTFGLQSFDIKEEGTATIRKKNKGHLSASFH